MSGKNIKYIVCGLIFFVIICGIAWGYKIKSIPLDIVMITDDNYVVPTMVAINSAIHNKSSNTKYNFHIFTTKMADNNIQKLKMLESDDVQIRFLMIENLNLPQYIHVSKSTLLKYYIAEYLPNLDKVLYLDSDILVLQDLHKFWKHKIEDVYIAAVKDAVWFMDKKYLEGLDLGDREFYFNSGVMLMNLENIRKDGILHKLEDYTIHNSRSYMDQDAFNVVVGDKVKELPMEYNTIVFFWELNKFDLVKDFYDVSYKNIEEVFSSVIVLHFASDRKPWKKFLPITNPLYLGQKLWYQYYNSLPNV